MFKKIILATTAVSVISVSALAACGGGMGIGMGACGSDTKGGSCGFEKNKKTKKSPKGCGSEMGGGCCNNGVMSLSTVKLTDEQKRKIEEINEEFRSEMAKLHIKERDLPRDPFAVPGGFDKERFKKERVDRMQKKLELNAARLAKIWDILTVEQQKSISELAK